jgi:hypothetical protein
MISSLEISVLIATLFAGILLSAWLPRSVKAGVITTAFLAATVLGFAQPTLAGAVKGGALSEGQKALNEQLQTTPQGNQYQGIEYPEVDGAPLSDQAITERIRDEIPNNLKLSVSNGAVRLSGKVSDRRTAQRIVQDIKEIPGVHEVSYDLGLAG